MEKLHFTNENKLKRMRIAMLGISIILVIGIIFAVKNAFTRDDSDQNNIAENEQTSTQVQTQIVGENNTNELLQTAGVVTAETKIDASALAPGTVRNLYIEIGDEVSGNQLIAQLYDGAILTNFETSRANYNNIEQSLSATRAVTTESINLTTIAVEQALQSVASAEIAATTAKNNYDTTLPIHAQQTKKAIQDAIISYHTNLANIQDALDDINFIIRAKGTAQLQNISSSLGINDPASVDIARASWLLAEDVYKDQILKTISEDNTSARLNELVSALNATLTTANDSVAVMQFTTSSFLFSEAELEEERSNMVTLKTGIANNKAAVTNSVDALVTLSSNQEKEQTAMLNAIDAANNQLSLAQIAYSTSQSQLTNAKNSQDQQILGSQTTLDSARGQRNLASQSVADLSVRTPISGEVTRRYVEVGAKVTAGQKIAEISQTDLVSINVGLSQADASRVRIGDVATIEEKYAAVVNRINPSADPFSRKIQVEIVFDNSTNQLIPETFVNVEIPLTEPIITQTEGDDSEIFLIPIKAVTITNSERYVYIVDNGSSKKVVVETGNPSSENIEIISGLSFGDILIIDGNKQIENGDNVSVVE